MSVGNSGAGDGGSRSDHAERPGTAMTSGDIHTSALHGVMDLPTMSDAENLPKQIGKYKIVRKLGRGGMGVVLLGVRDDDQFHKRVAIKLIRRGIDTAADGSEVLKRFDLERQVLGALNHPNIARLLDAGQLPEPDGRPYFVMEYVEGEPIDEFCDRMQLSTEQRLTLFQKVCAAVQHAHQNLVIHRDIKPGNILVDVNGEPKLMDFGIAKLINPAMGALTMATAHDRGPMTPEYASPEQVQGKPVSTISDVYALGVLLYELLTGRRPYRLKSKAIDAMVRAICEDEPERPSTAVTHEEVQETNSGETRTVTADTLAKPREGAVTKLKRRLSGDVDNIVLMAMRKSPQRRYPSAEALAADIQRHLEGQPVTAAPDSVVYRAGKFVRRNKMGVAAVAAVVLAIAAGGTIAAVEWRREHAERIAKEAALARSQQLLGAVRKFGTAYTKELPRVIGPLEESTPALRALADSAITGLQDLRADFADDVDMQREVANAYALAGRIRAGMRGGTENDGPAGLKLLDEALSVHQKVVTMAPTDRRAKMELATTLIYRADALKLQKRGEDSKKCYAEALKVIEDLGAENLDDPVVARTYATTLLARGDSLRGEGKLEDAGKLYTKSMSIRERLASGADRDLMRQRDLSVGLNRIGLWKRESGDSDGAIDAFRRAYEIRERCLKQERTARTMADAATASSEYGMALLDLSPPKIDQAEPVLTRAVELVENLSCSDASDKRGLPALVRARTDLGVLRIAQGDSAAAAALFTKAIQGAKDSAPDSKDPVFLQELVRAHHELGDLRHASKDDAAARAEYQAALRLVADMGDVDGVKQIEDSLRQALAALKR
jgi:serine/threonine protein kinase/tetratricopeptide (TPR) repeat protein